MLPTDLERERLQRAKAKKQRRKAMHRANMQGVGIEREVTDLTQECRGVGAVPLDLLALQAKAEAAMGKRITLSREAKGNPDAGKARRALNGYELRTRAPATPGPQYWNPKAKRRAVE